MKNTIVSTKLIMGKTMPPIIRPTRFRVLPYAPLIVFVMLFDMARVEVVMVEKE